MAPAEPSTQSWYRWPPMSYILVAGFGLFALARLWSGLRQIEEVLFLVFLAILVAVVMSIPIGFLSRWMWRGVATILVLVAILGAFAAMVALAAPKLADQASKLSDQIPVAREKVKDWWDHARHTAPITPGQSQQLQDKVTAGAATVATAVPKFAYSVVEVVGALFLLLVIGAFLAYSPQTYVDGLLMLVPKPQEKNVAAFLVKAGKALQGWLLGTLAAMTSVAILIGGALAIMGVKAWLILGVIMFFCEFVPFLGPVLGAIPGVAFGLTVSFKMGLEVAIAYFVLQHVEGYVIQPLVMRRAIHLKPALLIVWQLLMGGAFGILGLVCATPILAIIKVAVEHFYVEGVLGKSTRERHHTLADAPTG